MRISNTEAMMENTCKRQHYYRFGLEIEPRFERLGPALTRGVIGHLALDAYYSLMKKGFSIEDCRQAAHDVITTQLMQIVDIDPDATDKIKIVVHLKKMIDGYVDFYKQEPFEVVETEKFYTAEIAGQHEHAMRLDLLARFSSGQYRGDYCIIDHKFVYNFKTAKEIKMDGQLAKYIKTVKDSGYTVTKGMFNEIRYRELKYPNPKDLYKRTIIRPSKAKLERIWDEQAINANRIASYRAQPVEDWEKTAVRNLNPFVCKYCAFATLCDLELDGHSIKSELIMNFQPNTYGYTDYVVDVA